MSVTLTAALMTLAYADGRGGPAAPAVSYALSGRRHGADNALATRAQVWGGRAFVVTPRFRPDVPFTLSAVRLSGHPAAAVMSPYPARTSLHDGTDPDGIRNAVDLYLDRTGVLWVLDAGATTAEPSPVRRTPPRVFAIDVNNTDEVSDHTRTTRVWRWNCYGTGTQGRIKIRRGADIWL